MFREMYDITALLLLVNILLLELAKATYLKEQKGRAKWGYYRLKTYTNVE